MRTSGIKEEQLILHCQCISLFFPVKQLKSSEVSSIIMKHSLSNVDAYVCKFYVILFKSDRLQILSQVLKFEMNIIFHHKASYFIDFALQWMRYKRL